MKFTFTQYTENPLGKANGVFTHRQMYRDMYTQKFNKINLREAGKIDYACYTEKASGRYFIHVKIPSEVVEKFYYDVVVEFYPDKATDSVKPTLENYNVRFFSNDPAFVYTFAYAFNKHDCFIKELAPRMSKRALTDKAMEKNPKSLVGYVKSIYFTYIFMKSKNLFTKARFDQETKEINFANLMKNIEPADKWVIAREEAGKKQAAKDREKKKETHDRIISDTSIQNRTVRAKVTKAVKTTGNIVSRSKKSKTTKKI